jgi:TolA-binding protein
MLKFLRGRKRSRNALLLFFVGVLTLSLVGLFSVVVSGGTLREPERLSHGKALRVSQTSMNTQPVGAGGAVPASSAEPRQSPSPSAAPSHVEKPAAPHAEPFRAVFAAGSPTDLVTLSKELQKRGDLRGATRALMALRTRFPSDPRAVLAAQTLTELALARRDCDEARRWLGVYAASAPSGAAPPELSQRAKACGKAR